MTLNALIWDVDGTLVDSEDLHRRAFNQAFSASGLDWRWTHEIYAQLLGVTGGRERILHYARSLGREVGPEWLQAMHDRKGEIYQRDVRAGKLVPRPGVNRILAEAASQGLRLAIATSSSEANVQAMLQSGILGDVSWDVIVAGDQIPAKKPAPDVYLEALCRLNLEPGRCLALEDSEAGLQAALGAGIPTVILRNRYTWMQHFTGALVVLNSLHGDPHPMSLNARPVTMNYLRAWHAAAAVYRSTQ
jgi:HAD superfamily hydrolase (TIGR01509 family)